MDLNGISCTALTCFAVCALCSNQQMTSMPVVGFPISGEDACVSDIQANVVMFWRLSVLPREETNTVAVGPLLPSPRITPPPFCVRSTSPFAATVPKLRWALPPLDQIRNAPFWTYTRFQQTQLVKRATDHPSSQAMTCCMLSDPRRAYGGSDTGSVFLQSFARTLLQNHKKLSWQDMCMEVRDEVKNSKQV